MCVCVVFFALTLWYILLSFPFYSIRCLYTDCSCAERVTVVVSCVCLSEHAILAVRAVTSITKDAIVLSVRFAAILKRRFS